MSHFKFNRATILTLVLGVFLVLANACTEEKVNTEQNSDSSSNESSEKKGLDAYFSAQSLGDSSEVGAIRAASKSGDQVVVRGRVKDFVSGFAAFTLVDESMLSCDRREGDNCKTPWDYCCVESNLMTENTIAVEIRAGDEPLTAVLKGFQGLDHLTAIQVKGTIEKSESGNVILIVENLHKL